MTPAQVDRLLALLERYVATQELALALGAEIQKERLGHDARAVAAQEKQAAGMRLDARVSRDEP